MVIVALLAMVAFILILAAKDWKWSDKEAPAAARKFNFKTTLSNYFFS
jgi:hypothetical protein